MIKTPDENRIPLLPRLRPLGAALAFAVAGATAVAISCMDSDGYAIIVTGPIYLAVCGLTLLITAARVLRFVSSPGIKWLLILGCSVAALLFASWAGVMLGTLINRVFLHWPVSDHRLP